jgi:succinate dehydrogenase / fumarate reductase cytochrome b subunit
MESRSGPTPRKKVLKQFVLRSLKRERLGFEAYMWAAHRVTGLGLLAFLIFHLATLSTLFGGRAAYDQMLQSLDRPLIQAGEVILLGMISFHGLNGLRLIVFNLLPSVPHKRLAYLVCVGSLLFCFVSIPFIFRI